MRYGYPQFEVGRSYELWSLPFGKTYPHPTKPGNTITTHPWTRNRFTGDLPLLHALQRDEEFITRHSSLDPNALTHGHIAWQFVPEYWFKIFKAEMGANLLGLVCAIEDGWEHVTLPERKQFVCARSWKELLPIFGFDTVPWNPQLEAQYKCGALVAGKCPHRGTPVEAMRMEGAKLICPAHGMRFSPRTGQVIPRIRGNGYTRASEVQS